MDAAELFRRYGNRVYRLAWSYTGCRQDAEDVTQTVFLKLLEGRARLEEGKERAWLLQVTVNECRSLWRTLSRHRCEPLEEAAELAAPEEQSMLSAVMDMPARDRAVLYLFYYEGYSTREVGELLGIRQTAVTTRLQRAREKLKKQLEQEGTSHETGV